MNDVSDLIFLAGGLIIVSIFAGLLSSRVGAPLLLVFLGLGVLVGEDGIFGVRFDNFELAYTIATLSLAVILFDGGLRTSVASARAGWAPASLLATLGVLVTSGITGAAAVYLLDLSWLHGLLIGAIVGSTDAAAVFLLLHQQGMELRKRLSATLEMESGANDPMAIFLTITLVELIGQDAGEISWLTGQAFLLQMGLGVVGGVVGGFLLTSCINRVDLAGGLYPVFALAAGLTIFGGTQLLDGSGFLAVYIAGIIIGNRRMRANQLVRRFHDGMAWFAQIAMFLMLGLLVTPSDLLPEALPAVAIALVLIFVARPVAVFLCLLPFRSFSFEERLFVAWVGLRGAVPLFLAMIPVLGGIPDSYSHFNIAFTVVLISLLLQGWTIPWVARRLGLELPPAPEADSRLGFDLLPEADRDLLAYLLPEKSPAAAKPIDELGLPRRVRIVAVLRQGVMQRRETLERLLPNDHVLLLSPPDQLAKLDRLFLPPPRLKRPFAPAALGLFTFAGDTPTGAIAEIYDLPVEEAERALPIGEFLRIKLARSPAAGDRLHLGETDLVIREVEKDAIVSVGVILEPERLGFLPGWLARRLDRWMYRPVARNILPGRGKGAVKLPGRLPIAMRTAARKTFAPHKNAEPDGKVPTGRQEPKINDADSVAPPAPPEDSGKDESR